MTTATVSAGTVQLPPAQLLEGSGMPGPREFAVPEGTILPVWSVNTGRGKFVARTPISVRIILDAGTFYAVNEKLGTHGVGASTQAAVDDLCVHIGHSILHYAAKDSRKLAGLGLELKKLYERTFFKS